MVDFSASINPLGPSPAVRTAIVRNIGRIAHYPEREPRRLLAALAQLWSIDEEQILTGNGATELIYFLARMNLGPMALALPVFSEFHRAFPTATTADLQNSQTWPTDRPLVLTRPANPLGSTVSFPLLKTWLGQTTNAVLLDESFLDFSQECSAASLLKERPGLMILRSLTKFYALPGLRIGALLSSAETVASWKSHREPWQVNVLAEEAALAAVADNEHAARTLSFVKTEREWLFRQIQTLAGTTPYASDANFLYVGLNYSAQPLYEFLAARKLLVRNCADWPGLSGQAVRIAVRTRIENETLIHHWRQFPCAS